MIEEKKYPFAIEVDENIRETMEELKLVDDDINEVIDISNKLNRRTYDKESDEYICYAKLNYITCWVRYKKDGDTYNIKKVYTHRMYIDLEAVWNGRKVETDM